MITIKDVKDRIVEHTLPHQTIIIEVFDDHVEFLGLSVNSVKPDYKNIPNVGGNVNEYSYELYRVLSNYNESSEAYIRTTNNHIAISDNEAGGWFTHKHKCDYNLSFNNSWETVFNILGNSNGF
jgi:hypothetical protein